MRRRKAVYQDDNISVCVLDFSDHQILDQVERGSGVCLCGDVLHLFQDHPQHPSV